MIFTSAVTDPHRQTEMGNSSWSSARIEGDSQITSGRRWPIRFVQPGFCSAVVLTFVRTAGATLAANETAHKNWCDDLATKLLCVFALDRFGDYVSDQVRTPSPLCVTMLIAETGRRPSPRNGRSSTRDSPSSNATIINQFSPTNPHRHGRARWCTAVSWSRWSSSR